MGNPVNRTSSGAAPVFEENDSIIEKDGVTPTFQPSPSFHLPALAIPTVSKQKFVCPLKHISALRELIPRVTKIAVIGWRARERNCLDMLTAGLRKPVRFIAACADEAAANETLSRLQAAGVAGDFQAMPGSFTEFAQSRRMESFVEAAARA